MASGSSNYTGFQSANGQIVGTATRTDLTFQVGRFTVAPYDPINTEDNSFVEQRQIPSSVVIDRDTIVPTKVVVLPLTPRRGDRRGRWEGSIKSANGWRLSVVTQMDFDPLSDERQNFECAICRDTPTFEFMNLNGGDDPTMFCFMCHIEVLASIVPMIDADGNLPDSVKTWWREFYRTSD